MDKVGVHELKAFCGNSDITVKNILFGEVWLAGGQSNMEYSLNATQDGQADIPVADYPDIHFFKVPRLPYRDAAIEEPNKYADEASWTACSPDTAGGFPAVAFHFAKCYR